MTDIDLHKEYDSRGESVQDLFDSTEEGFFVPFYQREYTWEEDNINQLFDDLVLGVRELPENDNTTTFHCLDNGGHFNFVINLLTFIFRTKFSRLKCSNFSVFW